MKIINFYKYEPIERKQHQNSFKILCAIFTFILLVILAIYCGIWYQISSQNQNLFTEFIDRFNKKYSNLSEFTKRQKIFEENLSKINEFNNKMRQENRSIRLEINQFGDLTSEEFKSIYLHKIMMPSEKYTPHQNILNNDPISEIDWEKSGFLTPVKDQGNCGSCWAFGAISGIEALYGIQNNKKIYSFSEQELLDCTGRFYDSEGCNGGESCGAFRYIFDNGISNEENYEYIARKDFCRNKTVSKTKFLKKGCVRIDLGLPKQIHEMLQKQPLTISVEADNFAFRFYKSGLISEGCGTSVDHSVLLVGTGIWDKETNTKYWKIRNSWGINWGVNGYAFIERNDTEGSLGPCGVNMFPIYPA